MLTPREIANRVKTLREQVPLRLEETDKLLGRTKSQHASALVDGQEIQVVSNALQIIQDRLSADSVQFVQDFLTKGIRTVYKDRALSMECEVVDRGPHKALIIRTVEEREGRQIKSHVTRASGGGIQVLVSFLFQVLFIMSRNMRRVLFLDESFTQVSREYREGLGELLNMLTVELGFDILLVTHDREFEEIADAVYVMKAGEVRKRK